MTTWTSFNKRILLLLLQTRTQSNTSLNSKTKHFFVTSLAFLLIEKKRTRQQLNLYLVFEAK